VNHLTLIPAIHRAAHSIAAFLDADPDLPVTQAEAHVLAHLAARGSCTVGQIHSEFGHKRSTLTSILNRLEERGFITCTVNQSDKRSLMIGLTYTGETVAQSILQELLALEKEILSAFSPRDQKSALWILTAVKTVAEREPGAT
jgi:DNA-binding MarR family transcriptional regulator